eukprot:gb/GECG01001108.1/.p1 GENE.gb/GECG01001108.1/~~gb/GECG01001108.1/.p1  ORF type:complete len:105 (+),score=10.68 gb/GECG01001108.1/:1-315(+)
MPGSQGVFGLPVLNAVKPIDIDMSMHQENRERLTKAFHSKDVPSNSIIFLKGGSESARYNTGEYFYSPWLLCFGRATIAGIQTVRSSSARKATSFGPSVRISQM